VEAFVSTPAVFTLKQNDVNHGGDGRLILLAFNVSAGGYADFAALSLKELRRVCKNLGKAAGAPATIQLGNGYTSTGFPAKFGSNGLKFDGGDYMQVENANMPDLGNNFTIAALVRVPKAAAYVSLCSKSGGASGAITPYLVWFNHTTSKWEQYIGNGVSAVIAASPPVQKGSISFVAGTCDSSFVTAYGDNAQPGTPVARTINSVNNALSLIIGAADNTPSYAYQEPLLGFAIFPYTLNQIQIKELEYRMRLNATRK